MKKDIITNHEMGFFGTIQTYTKNASFAMTVWDVAIRILKDMYPNRDDGEIKTLLSSRIGRHFADSLVDGVRPSDTGKITTRLLSKTKLCLDTWWEYFEDAKIIPVRPNMQSLYLHALINLANNPEIHQAMNIAIGASNNSVWKDALVWLKSGEATTTELSRLWKQMQTKFPFETYSHAD